VDIKETSKGTLKVIGFQCVVLCQEIRTGQSCAKATATSVAAAWKEAVPCFSDRQGMAKMVYGHKKRGVLDLGTEQGSFESQYCTFT